MPPQKTFHVFIDRTRSDSPEVIARVAAGIAARFGVPAAMIQERLAAGRFRVKGNVDLDKATRFKTELEALGTVCSIVPADAPEAVAHTPITRLPTPPPMPVRQAMPRPSQSAPVASQSAGDSKTGLAAAGTGDTGSLGALDDGDALMNGSIRLSTLDGADDPPLPARDVASFDPSVRELPAGDEGVLTLADDEPPRSAPAPTSAARPPLQGSFGPHDPFLPPEMAQEREQILELDTPLPSRPRQPPLPTPAARASSTSGPAGAVPEATHAVSALTPPGGTIAPEPLAPLPPRAALVEESPLLRARRRLADDARIRLAVGVLAAILAGFIPATVVSSLRESSAFAEIRSDLAKQYASATTAAQAEGLDAVRTASLELMASRRFNIAVTACLLWAVVGAGFAFVWFRRIDWRRYASSSSPPRPSVVVTSSGIPPPTSSGGGTSSV